MHHYDLIITVTDVSDIDTDGVSDEWFKANILSFCLIAPVS